MPILFWLCQNSYALRACILHTSTIISYNWVLAQSKAVLALVLPFDFFTIPTSLHNLQLCGGLAIFPRTPPSTFSLKKPGAGGFQLTGMVIAIGKAYGFAPKIAIPSFWPKHPSQKMVSLEGHDLYRIKMILFRDNQMVQQVNGKQRPNLIPDPCVHNVWSAIFHNPLWKRFRKILWAGAGTPLSSHSLVAFRPSLRMCRADSR